MFLVTNECPLDSENRRVVQIHHWFTLMSKIKCFSSTTTKKTHETVFSNPSTIQWKGLGILLLCHCLPLVSQLCRICSNGISILTFKMNSSIPYTYTFYISINHFIQNRSQKRPLDSKQNTISEIILAKLHSLFLALSHW